MKKYLFILALLTFSIAPTSLIAQSDGGSLLDLLKGNSNTGTTSGLELQAQEYFRAIISQNADGIYQFMNPNYVRKINNQAKVMKMIKDEFKLIQKDFKIISVGIKIKAKIPSNNTSPVKIPIQAEIASASSPKDAVTLDGEITAISIDNKWYFFHKKYFTNSLDLPGMSFAVSEDEEQVEDDEDFDEEYLDIPNSGIFNGKAISLPAPEYPKAAKAAGASGEVKVEVVIDETGEVIQATSLSGHKLLFDAAVDAAMEAKFKPFMVNGKAAKVKGTIIYNFRK